MIPFSDVEMSRDDLSRWMRDQGIGLVFNRVSKMLHAPSCSCFDFNDSRRFRNNLGFANRKEFDRWAGSQPGLVPRTCSRC